MQNDQIIQILLETQDALGALAAEHFRDDKKVSQQEALAWKNIQNLDKIIDFLEEQK